MPVLGCWPRHYAIPGRACIWLVVRLRVALELVLWEALQVMIHALMVGAPPEGA